MRFYIWLGVFAVLGMAMCANARVPDYCEGYTVTQFKNHCGEISPVDK